MFVEPEYARSAAYKQFQAKLGRGEFDSGKYKRIGKGNREVWIQASQNPVFDLNGNPVKAVKFANDVTQTKLKASDSAGWVTAISQAQAVLEFDLTNIIPDANEIF